jgi:hypothetical protein
VTHPLDHLPVAEPDEDGAVSQVIRPAAVIPEEAAHRVLMQLSLDEVRAGGLWQTEPTTWRRFDVPWTHPDDVGRSRLIGSIHVAYGVPTRHEITIFRATVTAYGQTLGWTVTRLCDEALQHGSLSLDTCPRADLKPPPPPFRFSSVV